MRPNLALLSAVLTQHKSTSMITFLSPQAYCFCLQLFLPFHILLPKEITILSKQAFRMSNMFTTPLFPQNNGTFQFCVDFSLFTYTWHALKWACSQVNIAPTLTIVQVKWSMWSMNSSALDNEEFSSQDNSFWRNLVQQNCEVKICGQNISNSVFEDKRKGVIMDSVLYIASLPQCSSVILTLCHSVSLRRYFFCHSKWSFMGELCHSTAHIVTENYFASRAPGIFG